MSEWYLAIDGEQQGPMTADEIRTKLGAGELGSGRASTGRGR